MQRRPVPRVATSELELSLAFLDFQREVIAIKCEGLTEDELRKSGVQSGTSLLGLVNHLTEVEDYWFSVTLVGNEPRSQLEHLTAATALQSYWDTGARSNEICRRVGDPNHPVTLAIDGEHLPMRWVLAHMLAETARHAGHADILREQLDGATGR